MREDLEEALKNIIYKTIAALAAAILPNIGVAPVSAQTHRGKASFYSKKATGARASSGERIHHDSLTCAHRSYPFGTLLKVTNLSNGRSCIVRVNDRGPHRRGRIIDLSYGAASELGMLAQGIAMVEVQRVDSIKVPYRNEPVETGMPDFEFDLSELGGASLLKPFKPEAIKPPKKGVKLKKPKTKTKASPPTSKGGEVDYKKGITKETKGNTGEAKGSIRK